MASVSNSPTTTGSSRRNRVERSHKRPIVSSAATPDRKKRSSTSKPSIRDDDDLNLCNLPVMALTRVFFYLPSSDRISLSQTCRKLHQAEIYARRRRCVLNVRLDLICSYEDLKTSQKDTMMLHVFGSSDLFGATLRRSFVDQPGSICRIEKIAGIDFSPPKHENGAVDLKRWGGRTFLNQFSLSSCMKRISTSSLIEMRLHHCYVTVGTLKSIGRVFEGLELLSISLKSFECPPPLDDDVANISDRLISSVGNWSVLATRKKRIFKSDAVKQAIIFIYDTFPALETLLLYNE